jgi:hypothetical protein
MTGASEAAAAKLNLTSGGDVKVLTDNASIFFGADSEIELRHVNDTGIILKHTATADDQPIVLTLQTGETDMAADDVIGTINFQVPDEGEGTDAILIAAGISAISEGAFSSSSNATKLSFKTAASAAAAETMSLSSAGLLTTSGGITSGAGLIIANAGNIGSASDTDAIAIASDGVVTLSQIPVFSAGIGTISPSTLGSSSTAASSTLYADNIVKAWVRADGSGTAAIDDDHNISGMTDNGTGDYSFAIDRDMANTTYVAVGGPGPDHSSFAKITPTDAGNVKFEAIDSGGTARDHGVIMLLIIGEN